MSIPGAASPLFLATTAGAAAGFEISRSLRFNSGDSAHLSRQPSSAGNRKTWTWSGWFKNNVSGAANQRIFSAKSGSSQTEINLDSNGRLFLYEGPTDCYIYTEANLRDPSAWYHFVVVYDTTQSSMSARVKIYINGLEQSTTQSGSDIPQNTEGSINNTYDHRIGSYPTVGAPYLDGYLAEINFIDGSQLDPTSFGQADSDGVWRPKDTDGLTFGTNGFRLKFADNSSDAALGTDSSGNSNTWTVNNITANEVDYAATGTVSSTTGASIGPGNMTDLFDNDLSPLGSGYVSAYASGTHNVTITFSPKLPDGTTIELFGWKGSSASSGVVEVNGTDVSSAISAQYNSPPAWGDVSSAASGGIQTITLYRQDGVKNPAIAGIRVDGVVLVSGTPSNTDSLVDTPSNGTQTDTGVGNEVVGNHATLNPLSKGSAITLVNGNLDISAGSSGSQRVWGTIGVSSGKWYFEFTQSSGTYAQGVGIKHSAAQDNSDNYFYTGHTGQKVNASGTASSYGATWGNTDVIGVAFDLDAGTITFYKNGASQGQAFSGITDATYFPYVVGWSGGTWGGFVNFGQRAFAYTAPSGYKAINTSSLPTPTIADGSKYFGAMAYTGTVGGGTVTSSSVDFTPDFAWVKRRNAAEAHKLYDVVRGTDGTRYKSLSSNTTGAEVSGETGITAFVDGGFTSEGGGHINSDGQPFISWLWDAGTSTVTNNDGSIASQVRAQPSAGFSIVSYNAGLTSSGSESIGHGLNTAPALIIGKDRDDGTHAWRIRPFFLNDNAYDYLEFDTGALAQFNSNDGTMSLPTSTTFDVNWNSSVGASNDIIAYCFAPVAGYSAMGSYTANGSSDGPFVYTGFTVAFLLTKRTNASASWEIHDLRRPGYNPQDDRLLADSSTTEASSPLDLLSNGFKIRTSNSGVNNTNGDTYIYLAFASNPFASNGGLAR